MAGLSLLVGLGNPGPEYDGSRHNAGADWVHQIGTALGARFQQQSKFFGHLARVSSQGRDLRLLIPTTYMNRSGQAVAAVVNFYKIPLDQVLVAHDDLDLPPGTARLKRGGGTGGQNGLKDIIRALGNQQDFCRLRLGIGHPGDARQVTNYVLGRAPAGEREQVQQAMDRAADVLPLLLAGDWGRAQQQLHSKA